MVKEICYKDTTISYNLEYKNVKNINLRLKSDGTVNVSANKRVSENVIDSFVISKGDFILNAIKHYKTQIKKEYFKENEIKKVIIDCCEKVYPYFESRNVKFPVIKFRKMVSRWGSCHTKKGIVTFNTYLMYAPYDCIEYVVFHEFTHFLQPNHSRLFYLELEKICPDWKVLKNKLKSIRL